MQGHLVVESVIEDGQHEYIELWSNGACFTSVLGSDHFQKTFGQQRVNRKEPLAVFALENIFEVFHNNHPVFKNDFCSPKFFFWQWAMFWICKWVTFPSRCTSIE